MVELRKYLESPWMMAGAVIIVLLAGFLCFYDTEYTYSEDLTASGTYFASSVQADSTPKAFDGNQYSFWIANGAAPQWIGVDFGDKKRIQKLTLQHNMMPSNTNEFILQGSNDGDIWIDIYRDSCPNRKDPVEVFEFENKKSYRYYQVYIVSVYGTTPAIAEIEMMEKNMNIVRK